MRFGNLTIITCLIAATGWPSMIFCQGQQDVIYKVQKVFERLLEELPSSYPRPTLKFWPTSGLGAGYNKMTNEVFLDIPLLLNLNQKMSSDWEDAVAYVLGHELGHYYQACIQNPKLPVFISFPDAPSPFNPSLQSEFQADYFGFFITHFAGYATFDFSHKIISVLDENLSMNVHYRLNTAISYSKEHIKEYLVLSQIGELLIATGQYREAIPLLSQLRKLVNGRGISNNLAIAYLALVMEDLEPGNQWALPFEVDPELRLRRGRRYNYLIDGTPKENIATAISILKEIIENFPSFHTAKINLSCAYLLNNDPEQAILTVSKISPFQFQGIHEDWALSKGIILGVAFLKLGKKEKGIQALKKVIQSPLESPVKSIAVVNLQLIDGQFYSEKNSLISTNHPPSNFLSKNNWYTDFDYTQESVTGQKIVAYHERSGQLSAFRCKSGISFVSSVLEGSPAHDYCLKKNTSFADVQKCLVPLKPTGFLNSSNGNFFIFHKIGLVVSTNKSGLIQNWFFFNFT